METAQNGGSDKIQTDDHKSFSEISPSLNKQTIGSCSSMSSSQRGLLESSRELGVLFESSIEFGVLFDSSRELVGVENKAQAPKKPKRPSFKYFRWEIKWVVLKDAGKEWLRNPKNLALLIWGISVALSGAILFSLKVGLLNRALPKQKQRDVWFEVNNQILNALFTLICLYEHPNHCYHLSLLYRWKPEDIVKLRKVYCKNGSYKPHERAHIMVVVLLLQFAFFAQYAASVLNWSYKRSERPAIGVDVCNGVSIGAGVAAGLYLILSPLRKDYESECNLEVHADLTQIDDNSVNGKSACMLLEKRYTFHARESKRMEPNPEWQGGLFDCYSDRSVALFSTFCGFCVFGWNMDRLGFGNMYVHIVTFILLCMAPYWIFTLAAANIDNETIREGLGITGIILCVLGLLYGGFWRIQMRKRFGLPGNGRCCGQLNVTDLMQWLFCSVCSLCQEVRTGNFYEICDDKLYSKKYLGQVSQDLRDASPRLAPLGHEEPSPAVNSPSRVKSDMSPNVNAQQALVSPVLSPMHYSIANYLPPQGLSLVGEGSTFPLSNFFAAETHIAICPASESEDAHNVAAQAENQKKDGYPINAPRKDKNRAF